MTHHLTGLVLCVLLLPMSGCLESPCSRHGELCSPGSLSPSDPRTCEVMPEVASGDFNDGERPADIWALRVDSDFQDLHVRDVVAGWRPTGRAWTDTQETPIDGSNDCSCENDGGCPAIQVLDPQSPWVFVEVSDNGSDDSVDRSYTLHARGVLQAVLIRDDVLWASNHEEYGTTTPGLCNESAIGTEVQAPWASADEFPFSLDPLTEAGRCILGSFNNETQGDCFPGNYHHYSLTVPDDAPVRLTLAWLDPRADLDIGAEGNESGMTDNRPETILLGGGQGWLDLAVLCREGAPEKKIEYAFLAVPY